MINMLMVLLVLVGIVISVVRTVKYKDLYTILMTSLLTSFLLLVVSYFSYYSYYIHLSDGFIIYILLGVLLFIGIIFGLVKKNRQMIILISFSTTFYMFLAVYIPIFIGKYLFDGYGDRSTIFKVFFFLVLLVINYTAVYFVYYSGYSNSVYTSDVYRSKTMQLKESKKVSDQQEYERRVQKSETVDRTFYPINFYVLFIVSIVFVGLVRLDYDLDVEIDPNDTFYYKEVVLDLKEIDGAYFEDKAIYMEYIKDSDSTYRYNICVSQEPYTIKECIETELGYYQEVSFKGNIYFIANNKIYVFRLNKLIDMYEISSDITTSDVLLYIDSEKLYFETREEKYEIIDTLMIKVLEYKSKYDIGRPYTQYGHLIVNTDDNRSLIDGKQCPIYIPRNNLYFYEDLITDGEYRYEERSIHRIFDEKVDLLKVNGKLYYEYANKPSTLLYVNIDNKYDVIKINKSNLERTYISQSNFKTGEDGMVYLDTYHTKEVVGYKFDFLSNNGVVNFSLMWLMITYIISSGLYFGINKETYRKR